MVDVLPDAVARYLSDAVFLTSFMFGWRDSSNEFTEAQATDERRKLSRELAIDTMKCMGICGSLGIAYKFSKGRSHYVGYLKALTIGSLLGFGVSIAYTSEKARERLVRGYLEKN